MQAPLSLPFVAEAAWGGHRVGEGWWQQLREQGQQGKARFYMDWSSHSLQTDQDSTELTM